MTFIVPKNVKRSIRDTTLKYDFTKMSKQDVFKAKLAHDEIPFGHIPVWKRKAFLNFCVENELLHQPLGWMDFAYLVKHEFTYLTYVSQVRHLPLGRILEWLADVVYKNGSHYHPFKSYVQNTSFTMRHRKKDHPESKYIDVTWLDGLLR